MHVMESWFWNVVSTNYIVEWSLWPGQGVDAGVGWGGGLREDGGPCRVGVCSSFVPRGPRKDGFATCANSSSARSVCRGRASAPSASS